MALVYRHRNAKNLEIFYVGISCNSNRYKMYNRPYELKRRSIIHKNYVTKHGEPIVEIIKENISNEDAKELEIFLISHYGRRNLKTGTLVNLTDGGDGNNGWIPSKQYRKNVSIRNKGKFLGKNNPMFGVILTKQQRNKLSEIQKGIPKPKPKGFQYGEKNHRFGKGYLQTGENNPNFNKGLKFSYDGLVYNSFADLKRKLGISRHNAKKHSSFKILQ